MKTFTNHGGHVGAIGETIGGVVFASYYLQDDVGVETSGRKSEESDPGYHSDEGGSAHSSSELSRDKERERNDARKGGIKRAIERGRGEQVAGHWKGVEVKGKGKVEEVHRRSRIDEGENGGRKQAVEGCFKLGQKEVSFLYFDVALLTGLLATGKRIAFERSEGTSEVEEVLKGAMEELETVGLFRKLYTMLVVSGLLFPQCAEGGAWDLVYVVENVDGRILAVVEAFVEIDEYNAYVEDVQVVISVEERLWRARDALRKEREAHAANKKELEELKEAIAQNAMVKDFPEFAMMQRSGTEPNDAELKDVSEEGTNIAMGSPQVELHAGSSSPFLPSIDNVLDTAPVGDIVLLSHKGSDSVEDDMFLGREIGEGVVPDGQPVTEEGAQTRQIPVDYVVVADEIVIATLNVSTVREEGATEDVAPSGVSGNRSVFDIKMCIDQEAGNPTPIFAVAITTDEDNAHIPSKATFTITSPTKSSTVEQVMSQVLKLFFKKQSTNSHAAFTASHAVACCHWLCDGTNFVMPC
ncbi:hypothetical protein Cgig2_003057 [Carnegiea gigantea]|uniref:Uncharacterized protein n=1 Tax=Carnegiea gigantea TaxID=171969 RepID=A0A9Q1JSY7_9CARY|nr:hypothetical protein Cgig2_003057 [Carnegiea gigantea]